MSKPASKVAESVWGTAMSWHKQDLVELIMEQQETVITQLAVSNCCNNADSFCAWRGRKSAWPDWVHSFNLVDVRGIDGCLQLNKV